jgi:serine protease Do
MRRFFLLAAVLVVCVFAYQRWDRHYAGAGGRRSETFTAPSHPKLDLADVRILAAIDAEYSTLIGAVTPSVVCIRSRGLAPVDPLEFLLRGGPRASVRSSIGSGVIVSKEGHVVTNAHVIAGMSEIVVQLNDGRSVPAQLIGVDQTVDIAVLRIPPAGLEALPLGDSDQVRVGQMVFAIGNPFGLRESVTQGIISAKGRSVSESGVEFLQTDAAVNQGNSGGPLLNLRGEVIGINSAIYSETGGWLGISLAIPSNVARRAMESILRTGRVVRPFLGVTMIDLSPDLAEELGSPDSAGVLVLDVLPDGPAAKAGLRRGDIIRTINGRPVAGTEALRQKLGSVGVGGRAELRVLRGGQEFLAAVQIAEAPENLAPLSPRNR